MGGIHQGGIERRGIHQGEFDWGELVWGGGGNFPEGNSPRREKRKYMKKGNFNNKTT